MRLDNLEFLVNGHGQVTLGAMEPVECVAVAADEHQTLAMLVRQKGESLGAPLERLDAAIAGAWERGVFIDAVHAEQ